MATTNDTVLLQEKVDVIALHIKVDGDELPREYHVVSVSVHQGINKVPSATILLVDGEASEEDFSISSSGKLAPGKKIEISLGYVHEDSADDEPFLFTGLIISNTHRVNNHCCELTVECKDETVVMTLTKSNAHWEEKITATKIAEDLLEKNKIEDSKVDSIALKHAQLMQANVTDWDFMIGRIDVAGMICVIDNGNVRIKELKVEDPPKNESGKMLQLVHGRNILQFSADKDSRIRSDEVKVVTWDFKEQKVKESSNSDTVAEDNNTDEKKITSGYEIRSSTFLSQEEQDTIARMKKLKQDLSIVKGTVSFIGRTDIKVLPGDFVELKGVGKLIDGYHFVSALQHEYNDGCWITEATLGWNEQFFSEQTSPQHPASATGQTSALQGLQIGVVTAITDSDGEYRVKVKLPMVDEKAEGLYARVATLDAGAGRGTFFRPEKDDEVLLGFVNDDPSNPVILGMLHSSAKQAPLEPEDKNAQKGYTSRSKIKLLFDDEKKSITIETPGKRVFELNDDSGTITLKDDNGNKLVMESSGISIEAAKELKLKAGTNLSIEAAQVSIKADGSFEAKGNGTAKIEGGGLTEIKGGIVKIN